MHFLSPEQYCMPTSRTVYTLMAKYIVKKCNVTKQTEIFGGTSEMTRTALPLHYDIGSSNSNNNNRKMKSQRAVSRWRQRQQKRMSTCLWQLSDENIKLIANVRWFLCYCAWHRNRTDCHRNNSFTKHIFRTMMMTRWC